MNLDRHIICQGIPSISNNMKPELVFDQCFISVLHKDVIVIVETMFSEEAEERV